MKRLREVFDREPVLVFAAVRQLLAVAVSFGLHLTADQMFQLGLLIEAVTAIWTRGKVQPLPPAPPDLEDEEADA